MSDTKCVIPELSAEGKAGEVDQKRSELLPIANFANRFRSRPRAATAQCCTVHKTA